MGRGPAADRLAERLLRYTDDELSQLHGAAGATLLVILGSEDDLPWVDGIEYLARAPEAAELYLPTHRTPTLSAALLSRALHHNGIQGPVALLETPPALIDLVAARPLHRGRLTTWLKAPP